MTTYIEKEFKLCAPSNAVLAQVRADARLNNAIIANTGWLGRAFHARYYDTQTLQLQALRWSLRARQEGEIMKMTLKRGSSFVDGFLQCEEMEQACDEWLNNLSALPDSPIKNALASELPDNTELVSRIEVKVTRTQTLLEWNGAEVEVVTDEGAVYASGKSSPVCEVELELKKGEPQWIADLVAHLRHSYSLTPSTLTKHGRGQMLLRAAG